MSSKKPTTTPTPTRNPNQKKSSSSSFRDGLGIYLTNPTAPAHARQHIFHTPTFVAIHDLYPKATLHALLLPRTPPALVRQHPFDALSSSASAGPAFLAAVRTEAARLADLVANELQRRLGRFSAAEADRNAVLDGITAPMTTTTTTPDEEEEEGGEGKEGKEAREVMVPVPVLPKGRDWRKEVKVGVHAVPSMNHLHIHVLSRDMHSDRLKHRKHYNSFTTDFFVPLDDFPLAEDDWRRQPGAQRHWPERPLVCWRCGRDFGNRFKELKEHLDDEFEEWKRE